MKTAVFFVALLASSLATTLDVDWSKIQPKNIYIEPFGKPDVQQPNIENRIIGGEIAPLNSIPYIAALIMDGSGFCGGSVISREVILTAAHCTIDARNVQVILGSNRVNFNDGHQVIRHSNQIINHESYSALTIANDVSLVRLSVPVEFNHAIQAIQLAPSNAPDYSGSIARLAGWGRTSEASQSIATHLKTINLQVITNARCFLSFLVLVRDSIICTSGDGNRGACNGDSGGPLVLGNTQIGIVSFGGGNCEAGRPTAFSRVSSFRDWISRHSGV